MRSGRNLAAVAILGAAMLSVVACDSGSDKSGVEKTTTAAIQPGVPGGVFVETSTLTATVKDIDPAKRMVTLTTADGEKDVVHCGPEVRNFEQICVGDRVTVKVIQETVVQMSMDVPAKDSAAAVVALTPKGAKPGGVVAATMQTTATVTAIDMKNHKATLRFADGTVQTVAVRPDVDLTQHKVGELIYVRVTQAVALSVTKQ